MLVWRQLSLSAQSAVTAALNWGTGTNFFGATKLSGLGVAAGNLFQMSASGTRISTKTTTYEASSAAATMSAVANSGGRYVMVGDDRQMYTATSRIGPWTNVTSSKAVYYWKDIAFGNGSFVAIGSDTILYAPSYVNTAAHWVEPSPQMRGYQRYGIAFGNGIFVACGAHHVIRSTNNGSSWTQITVGDSGVNFFDIVFDGLKFIMCGSNGNVWYSVDGAAWTKLTHNGGNETYRSIAYVTGKYVAVAADTPGKTLVSTDGIAWAVDPAAPYSAGEGCAVGFNNQLLISDTQGRVWIGT